MANQQQTVTVPDLGGATDVEVIELCVTNGDTVDEGQSLIVVESDKASMEVPSPLAGKIVSIEVSEGSSVSEGDPILQLEVAADAAASDTSESSADEAGQAEKAEASPAASASPAAPETSAPQDQPAAEEQSSQAVVVPDLGGADSVELIEVLVQPGDEVAEGDGLLVMESDKASMELPSPCAGVVESLTVEVGASLSEGQQIATIKVASSAAKPAARNAATAAPAAANQAPATNKAPAAAAKQQTDSGARNTERAPAKADRASSAKSAYAGPAVRKLARELGVDLMQVQGSGPRSRIYKEDLHDYVKQRVQGSEVGGGALPALPDVDFSAFGEVEIEKMSRLHKLTAANMQRSWLNVPHVTQFDDADISELEKFRKGLKPQMEKRGVKISPLPFIVKAVAIALRDNPAFNVSLGNDGETIVRKKYIHIGLAVDTPAGLMVPVVRDADSKGVWALAEEIAELAAKARERKLTASEMQGGCFTISSLGGIGGQGFTPIINTPEVGILGVSKASVKPVFNEGAFEPRTMLPLSLSYDHRAVNGGDAGRFLTTIVGMLGDMRHVLL